MRNKLTLFLLVLALTAVAGCATVRGTILGAGVGYMFGDADMGAEIGATVGLVRDIWD